ncbi:MAG: glycosyltransferase family 4 protein, partial [Kiritimatiellae bacterium]|nr:glycosyltransferase family 4 protein [Kiritimatiellia bacterium]
MSKLAEKIRQARTWGLRGVVAWLRRLPHERAVARFLARNAAAHAGETPMRGITVVAPMSATNSLSKAMRDFVVRLRGVGVPCQVFDTNLRDGRVARADFADLITPRDEFNLLKYDHVVEMLASPLPAGLPVKRCRVAFWEGEAGILKTFPYLADSDVVIAMSDFNAAYYRREFPASVEVSKIVYPLLPVPSDLSSRAEMRRRFSLDAAAFCVFFNFDARAGERKNVVGAVRAFEAALGDVAAARLVLKVNGARERPDALASVKDLARTLGVAEKLLVVTDYLSSRELYSLTAACDAYLSLHRAEGFGLGMAEAMQLGVPVVATNYSANTEFCTDETAFLVPCTMVPVDGDAFQAPMERWAEPDVAIAARHLRALYGNPSAGAEKAAAAKRLL